MAVVTFFTVSPDAPPLTTVLIEQFICQKTVELAQAGKKIFVAAQDKQQALSIDEQLWQLELSSFVAHNLVGEGGKYGSQVEIGWPGTATPQRRDVLINLAEYAPNFAISFHQVIEFVPCDENKKQQARERYKQYRLAGFTLETTAIPPTL
ncbi:DNA polymerase III subunit chi [Vibrio sp. SS-MA-C1-2]|uniref:DNA polymerase III subunit chi n=1 Tax=Vibrio sp. SS-MA-C1-2 TaxID=2908646 RepID=UPI001F2082C5|nr:DNA polymerase III subunit chi [Vibrio sp. SS-MA-C1-2]UJF19597.1 DNA polymerase III subunit chi [Vibrio sp. SS-MA-C1-2]